MKPTGTGTGVITEDGCPVEVYLRFPHQGEADLVHAVAPPGGTVLDLGCGTGRIAHPLIALGHRVTGVDSSADMLAHVHDAETVLARIAGLDLGRTFDVVLLASHFVNTVDDAQRHEVFAAAGRHVAPGGALVAERYPPDWFDTAADRTGGHIGDVGADLVDVHRDGDVLQATVRYWVGNEMWTQTFDARRIDDEALRRELGDVGLTFERWLRDDHSWFAARRPQR